MNQNDRMQQLEARLAVLEKVLPAPRYFWPFRPKTRDRLPNDQGVTRIRNKLIKLVLLLLLPAGLLWAAATIPNTFSDGETLSAAKLNANFQALAAAGDATPVGTIVAFAGSTAPTGWLLCDGTQVSRTAYSALYAVTANAYGSGDGSTSFHLPDLRGRFLRGVDGSAGVDPDKASRTAMNSGGNTGNNIGSVQTSIYGAHKHAARRGDNGGASWFGPPNGANGFQGLGDVTTVGPLIYQNQNGIDLLSTEGGNETRPVNAYVNFIIKY